MEKYKIVLNSKNVGNSGFCIIHKGECLYKDKGNTFRRDVGFVSQKNEKLGDAYEIEFVPEGTKYLQNPYCRKVKKLECNNLDRLSNLIEAFEITITQYASTKNELCTNNNKFNNFYFIDNFYLLDIQVAFNAIIKYFKDEKQEKYAKKVQKILQDFSKNCYTSLDIGENVELGQLGNAFDPVKFIRIVKKKYFSFLTLNQKVVSFVHETVKNDAKKYYDQIKEICGKFIEEKQNEKSKNKTK